MEQSQLLNGLTYNSLVSDRMLSGLKEMYRTLVARSVANTNWTEDVQRDFEVLHTIICRHESREAAQDFSPRRKPWVM